MNNEQIIKSLQEAQIAFRMLSHLPDAAEVCKHHDERLNKSIEQLTKRAP